MTRQTLAMFTLAALLGFAADTASAQSKKKAASGAKPTIVTPFANTVEIGDKAPTVQLTDLEGRPVNLADTFDAGDTVLVVLRGYPGYQCGICSRQASGYMAAADKFSSEGYNVVMVYPGQVADLKAKAKEFLDGKLLPAGVTMLLDPDYKLVDRYGLRWDAPNETAYPSTFVVEDGKVTWAKISRGHGDRADAKSVLAAVSAN